MNLLFVGWDHRAAPLDLRERLAFTPEKAREALDGLFQEHILSEGAIVSTCNRAEIYGMSDREDGLDALAGFFSRFHRVDDALLRRTALSGHGDATVSTSSASPRASTRWSSARRRSSGRSARRTASRGRRARSAP